MSTHQFSEFHMPFQLKMNSVDIFPQGRRFFKTNVSREMPGGVHVSQCQTVATFYSNHFSALLPSALSLSLCGEVLWWPNIVVAGCVIEIATHATFDLVFWASRVFRQRRMLSGNLCVPQRRAPPQYVSLMFWARKVRWLISVEIRRRKAHSGLIDQVCIHRHQGGSDSQAKQIGITKEENDQLVSVLNNPFSLKDKGE